MCVFGIHKIFRIQKISEPEIPKETQKNKIEINLENGEAFLLLQSKKGTYNFTASSSLGIAVTATTIFPSAYTKEMYRIVLQKYELIDWWNNQKNSNISNGINDISD